MRRNQLIARAFASIAVSGFVTTASGTPAVADSKTPVPVIVVDGRGFGHGVGMAQDGAYAMGLAGSTTQQILEQFYPGTKIGKSSGQVRVPVFTGNGVELGFPDGGELRGNSPTVKVAPGGTALLYRDGDNTRVKVSANAASPTTATNAPTATSTSSTTTTTRPTTTSSPRVTLFPQPAAAAGNPLVTTTTATTASRATTTTTPPVALFTGQLTVVPNGEGRVVLTPRNRRYRGLVEVTPVGGGLRFVNQLNLETYLRGMGEVRNPYWPPAALRAQAIAERTYALRAMAANGELCDSQQCQVYVGAQAEYPEMDRAIAATAGQVLMYGKSLASAVYSANGGGYSATREEGFGLTGASFPYLRAAPYLTKDAAPWTATIALQDVARVLHYRGVLTSVAIAETGPSGRGTLVRLLGSNGPSTVRGLEFDAALGLRSTMFTLRVTTAVDVPPLSGSSVVQAPPEDAPAEVLSAIQPSIGGIPGAIALPVLPLHSANVQLVKPEAEVGSIGLAAMASWMTAVWLFFRWRRDEQIGELKREFADG